MHPMMNYDAQAAMGFVLAQNTYIEAGVYQIKYPDIQYPDLIPVSTEAPPWVRTITYYSGDIKGAARWINGNADDIPLAGSELAKSETTVYTAAIGYGWGYEEIKLAMQMGYPLESNDARAARRAYEEFVDGVALRGDAKKNFKGLINNSGVTASSAPVGDWGSTGTDNATVLADLNAALAPTATDTLYQRLADTVLLPNAKWDYLATTNWSNEPSAGTLLEWFQKHNIYTQRTGRPLTIRTVRGLETAGSGSTNRIVAYRNDPEVLKLHIPLPLFFLPPWQAGPLRWEVPGLFRLGGLDIRLPKEVHYLDGI